MLTVCRFESLVPGLNLPKQCEFHVKAPLAATSAVHQGEPRVPGGRVWELGVLKRAGEAGGEGAQGKGGKLRGEEKFGAPISENNFIGHQKNFSCCRKFGGNFGVQAAFKGMLPDSNALAAASQSPLVSRAGRINSALIPGGEGDDGHSPVRSSVWWHRAQEGFPTPLLQQGSLQAGRAHWVCLGCLWGVWLPAPIPAVMDTA